MTGEWVKRKIKYKYELDDPLVNPRTGLFFFEEIHILFHPITGELADDGFEWVRE